MMDKNKKFEEYKNGTYTLERENGEVIILSREEIWELRNMQRALDGLDSIDAYESSLANELETGMISKEEYNKKSAAADELGKSYISCYGLYYDVQEMLCFDSWDEEKAIVDDYIQDVIEGVR